VKKGSMMLAAVETVTKADPVWESRRHNSDVAAQATAGEAVHAASPLSLEPHPRRLSEDERHRRSLVDRSGDIPEHWPTPIISFTGGDSRRRSHAPLEAAFAW
jgi:hypothetical protein